MREIIFDTETTGLDPVRDRLVEIGCVEVINHIPTGRSFHTYLNPGCAVSPDAFRVHGLSDEFLAGQPAFASVADEFLAFVGEASVVAHNASFDLAFINAELGRTGRPPLGEERVVDTLMMARRKHPAGPNSLDALCTRYGIDLSQRTLHGALLDATLLAEVYVELRGGRQAQLGLGREDGEFAYAVAFAGRTAAPRPVRRGLVVSTIEVEAHRTFVGSLSAAPIWLAYLGEAETTAVAAE
jgi:DNA polymerase-3 subunit epsilon